MAPGSPGAGVPRRTAQANLTGVSLTATEGFVLSQIDGRTSAADLELITGISRAAIRATLVKLAAMGLIELPEASAATPAAPQQAAAGPSPAGRVSERPAPAARPSERPTSVARASERPAPVARASERPPAVTRPGERPPAALPREAVLPSAPAERPGPAAPPPGGPALRPLEEEQRRRIDAYLARAESADYYAMLGVSRRAGRGQIRAAFFALAKEFHPDAYYGREIGDYLGRLERIFRTASRAFEVLSRPASRERYDEYLRGQSILAGKEEEERAWAEAERRASSPEETPAGPAEPAAAGAAEPAGAGAMTFEIPAIVVEERPWTEEGGEARAESLSSAGERGIQEGPPGGAASEPPPGARTSDAWHRERAVRRLTAALGAIRRERGPERRGTEYLRAAAEAAQTEEWGKVFGLLEAAEKLGLSDPEKAQHGELLCRAGRELGRICVSQASFAEQTGDLGTAIKHAESACRYEPDNPVQWDLLARLLLRQGRKLQRARDAAHRAIQLAPRTVEYRVTMVRVYLAAGLVKNARREAEAATKLAPDHPEARALLAEARKAKE